MTRSKASEQMPDTDDSCTGIQGSAGAKGDGSLEGVSFPEVL